MPLFCFLIPTWVPCHYWDEKPMYAWYGTIFRYTFSLNLTWLVNSAAHIWGMKPYDKCVSFFLFPFSDWLFFSSLSAAPCLLTATDAFLVACYDDFQLVAT